MVRPGTAPRRCGNHEMAAGAVSARRAQRYFRGTASFLLAALGCGLFLFGDSPTAQASHLRNASEARLQEVFKDRLFGNLERHKQISIAPSPTPRKLPRATEEVPDQIHDGLANSSAQSFLYWDGKAIRYDLAREGIRDDLPVYGMSMSKSITSYLLGRALCQGLVQSLDDPIKKYVPALDGTFYGDVALRDALDMASGDRKLYSDSSARGGPSAWGDYITPIFQKGVPIVEAMRALGNREPSENSFAYRNANTDAVALVLSAVAPGGLGEFASRTLAKDAGFEHPAMYLAGRNNAAFAFAFFYATRMDWLRAAILIGEEFRAKGCIGEYLRSAVSESVPTNLDRAPYKRYGKFFWSDRKWSNRKHVALLGHGGQRIFIDLEDGQVLYTLSIRRDFPLGKIYESVFE